MKVAGQKARLIALGLVAFATWYGLGFLPLTPQGSPRTTFLTLPPEPLHSASRDHAKTLALELRNAAVRSSRLPSFTPTSAQPDKPVQAPLVHAYGKLPMHFEPNQGQANEQVKFLARGNGYNILLTSTEAVMVLGQPDVKRSIVSRHLPATAGNRDVTDSEPNAQNSQLETVVRMKLVGASAESTVVGVDELPGKSNYLIGKNASKWHTNVPHYAKVKYTGVYPGIDLVFYGNQRQMEFDFIVAPGADPSVIQIAFTGADKVETNNQGDLVLRIADDEIRLRKPFIHQENEGGRQEISGSYVLDPQSKIENPKSDVVGFQVASYDASKRLVIDPVLEYSTFLGGGGPSIAPGDIGEAIAVDSLGYVYVTGSTVSVDFPTTSGAFDRGCGTDGFCNSPSWPRSDVFVAKLSPDGSSLVYSTYLGGTAQDEAHGIAIDQAGNAYITGGTFSTDLPVTPGAYDTGCGADGRCDPWGYFDYIWTDAFVAKLSPDGSSLVYCTYLGGSREDEGNSIAVDSSGNAYVTGSTSSLDFPTANAFQSVCGPSGLGGCLDAFVVKLAPDGSSLVFSTYLGGTAPDAGLGIAVNSSGNAYVTGSTSSSNFPTASAFQTVCGGNGLGACSYDAFLTKLSHDGTSLIYSTYLGGSGTDFARAIAVDVDGNAYVTGNAGSTDFPTVNPFQPAYGGGEDVFITKLNPDGSALVYSTYIGGSGQDEGLGIAVDSSGNAYVTGSTVSIDFPVFNSFQEAFGGPGPGFTRGDAFVTKLSPDGSAVIYSTYLGGDRFDAGSGVAVDPLGNAYVTGFTQSWNFPTANPFQPTLAGFQNGFVAKIAPAMQFSAASYGVAENSGSATITVLSGGFAGPMTVDFTTQDGTATAGSDYIATSGTLVFAPGETSRSFTIPIFPDDRPEPNETVNLVLSNPTGSLLGRQSTAVLTLREPGVLQFSSGNFSVPENSGSATITVTRQGGSGGQVSVDFSTSDGTATAGSDYVAVSGTLTFSDGQTSKSFLIPLITDAVVEAEQTVNLTLTNPTGGASLGGPRTAVLALREPGVLQFSSGNFSVAENSGMATIEVTRTGGSAGEVSVNFSTSDNTGTSRADFAPVTGTLSFAEGETVKTFNIPIWNDAIAEGDESVNVTLSDSTAGASLGAQSSAVLNIRDNDLVSSDSLVIGAEITIAAGIVRADSNTGNPGRSAIGFDGTNSLVVSCRQIGTPPGLSGVILSGSGVVLRTFQISQIPCPSSAAVSFDGSNYLVVFARDGQIFGIRVSPSGDMLGGPSGFAISTGIPFSITNFNPAVAFDGENYLVAWTKYDPAFTCSNGVCTYNLQEIFGARVTPQGQVLDEFPIFRAPGGQVFPSVAFDGINYLVVWSDTRSGSPIGPDADIFGARVTPGGTVLDPQGIPISIAPGSQGAPHVIFDGTNYFVVWRDAMGIFGRRVKPDGALLDGPPDAGGIAINTASASDPRVSFDGRNYFVVWHVDGFGPPAGIYLARVTPNGDVIDRDARLVTEAQCYACRLVFPDVLANGDSSLVTWALNSELSGTTKDIAGALICGFTSIDPNSACSTLTTSDYFPVLPGTTSTYVKNGSITFTTTVLDQTAIVGGVETAVFQDSDDGSKDFFTSDADGIRLHRLLAPNVFIGGLGTVNLELTFLPPLKLADGIVPRIGQMVRQSGSIRTNKLPRIGTLQFDYNSSFTVGEAGPVEVPAGLLEDVIGLRGTLEMVGSGEPPASFAFDLARGIGIVRSTTTQFGVTETAELVSMSTPLTIGASSTLANCEIGLPYNVDLQVSGGVPPYTVTVTKGALPAGLGFGSSAINGTPAVAVKKNFTVKVTDQLGASTTKRFTITVLKGPSITSKNLIAGTRGKAYTSTLKVTGGQKPFAWSLAPGSQSPLPSGFALNSSTGAITGTTAQTGVFNLTLQVTDRLGGQAQKDFTLTIK